MLWALCFTLMQSQTQSFIFNHLTIESGLSQNSVNCILKDSQGYMWFGTKDGLNRYDGFRFTIFKHNSSNPNSISDNYILSLIEDKNGYLWIGTENGGLNRFNPQTEKFTYYVNESENPQSLVNNNVLALTEDKDGSIWAGTWDGLSRLNPKTGKFSNYKNIPDDDSSLSDNFIRTMLTDKKGNIWVGTNQGGLNLYNANEDNFTHYLHDENDPFSIANNWIQDIFEDDQQRLWLGTSQGIIRFDQVEDKFYYFDLLDTEDESDYVLCMEQDKHGNFWLGSGGIGITIFNPESGEITLLAYDSENPYSVSNSGIRDLYLDDDGLMWIGMRGSGLDYLDIYSSFKYYPHNQNDLYSLSSKSLRSIYETQDSILWVGSYNGLDRIDRKNKTLTNFTNNPSNPGSISNKNVYCILEDNDNDLWIGTEGGGLNRFDRSSGRFEQFIHDENDSTSLSNQFVYVLHQDTKGYIWIGTENGLNRFDKSTGIFNRYYHDPEILTSLAGNTIHAIAEDRNGVVWIGTDNGLSRYDYRPNTFNNYSKQFQSANAISNNRIKSIYIDNGNIIWVGTSGGGLNRFDPFAHDFMDFNVGDGLSNDVIYGILGDDDGNLWLSTNLGITKVSYSGRGKVIEKEYFHFTTFDASDGLQSNEFNTGAYFKSSSGELFFGGINGLTSFFPGEIVDHHSNVKLILTDFHLFNITVPIATKSDENNILQKHISFTDEITLTHRDFHFSFEFTSLDYFSNPKRIFQYKLEGFDNNWLITDIFNRSATYTNVPPGVYFFHLKPSPDNEDTNSRETSIKVIIKPAPWKTWWAYSIYLISSFGSITVVIFWRIKRLKNRAMMLAVTVSRRTAEIRNNEKELQRQYQFLNNVIESLTHPFYVIDVNSRKLIMSNSASRQGQETGNITCSAMNQNTDGLDCKIVSDHCPLENIKMNKKPVKSEIEYIDTQGIVRFSEVNAYPIFDEHGNVIQMIEYCLDITKRKILENQLKSSIDSRNRELTAKAMHLAKNHEILKSIVLDIQDMTLQKDSNQKLKVRNIVNKLNSQISASGEWDEFELWFNEVHKDFYSKLINKNINLSSREMKICAFLKLNLNTKEIANLTNLTVKTIEVYRSKLRKKLELQPADNLNIYLSQL